ncbi:hypothetical protein LOC68_14345 [Blastopirellula sp. JC732]|uniref:SLA1 homology domain-containing protein n=1 Tax=Blastopirellula sediminis TaxID=2894196 RepID=A0A9X1MNQ7_9BACT|nr:hypothetical protein [Blastopirellula sediminis]MCC9607137.1 hypothetical protein [Blastopirellula sediminis]MCC9629570.1 hypothetical protein [Blastopirellula sediminis]
MFDLSSYRQRRWLLAVLLLIFFSAAALPAREWKSGEGQLLADGKLLAADSQQITLKLKDQSVTAIPLASLSRADREFVDATLAKSDAMRAAFYNQTHPLVQNVERPVTPPNGKWRSAVDPPQVQFAIPAGVKIPFTVDPNDGHPDSDETFIFPTGPSPFLFHAPTRTVCDLRSGSTQMLRKAPAQFSASAISPDGKLLALLFTRAVGAQEICVVLWDIAADSLVRTITLPTLDDDDPRIDLFAFAGADRIVVKEFSAQFILNITVSDGALKRLPCDRDSATRGGFALSPGGQFLFFYPDVGQSDRVLVYDLITGKPHGHLLIPAHPLGPEERTISHINMESGVNEYRRVRLWIEQADGMSVSSSGRYLFFFYSRHYQGEIVCYDLDRGGIVAHHVLKDELEPRTTSWCGDDFGCLVDGETLVARKTCEVCFERRQLDGEANRTARFVDTDKLFYADRQAIHIVRMSQWDIDKGIYNHIAGATDRDEGLPLLTAVPNPAPPTAWRVPGNQPLTVAPSTTSAPPQSAAFAPNSSKLRISESYANDAGRIVGSDEGYGAASFDMATGRMARYVPPESTRSIARDVSVSGRYALLTLDYDSKLRLDVFAAETMEPYASLRMSRSRTDQAKEVIWGGLVDDQHLAAVTQDGVLTCWTLPTCHQVYSVQLPLVPTGAFFSPQRDRILLAGGANDGIAIVDSASGEAIGRLHDISLSSIFGELKTGAFSSDGKTLSVAYDIGPGNRLISIWSLETGLPIKHVKSDLLVERLVYADGDQLMAIVGKSPQSAVRFLNGSLGAPETIQPSISGRTQPELIVVGSKIWFLDGDRLFSLRIPANAAGAAPGGSQ